MSFPKQLEIRRQSLKLATQLILDKLEALEMQEDIEAFDHAMEKHKSKGCKPLSHEKMMPKIGW